MDVGTVFEIAVGALLGFLGGLFIEHQKRPYLNIKIAGPATFFSADAIVTRLIIHNQPRPRYFRWLGKDAATHCVATHVVRNHDKTKRFEFPVVARWAGSPEPIRMVSPQGDVVLANVIDHFDLSPGQRTSLDVAIRYRNEGSAYLFLNQSYSYSDFKHPDYELSVGNYEFETTITTGGRIFSLRYLLENPAQIDGFRLSDHVPESVTSE